MFCNKYTTIYRAINRLSGRILPVKVLTEL
jgi:hypothetical protein